MHACKDTTSGHKSQRKPPWVYQREDVRDTYIDKASECIMNVNIMYSLGVIKHILFL